MAPGRSKGVYMGGRGLGRVTVPYVHFQNWLGDAERFSNDVCLPYVP